MHRHGVGLCAAWIMLLPIGASAQATVQVLRGSVTDAQDRPVASVTISVTGGQTGIVRATTTDSLGRYRVVYLERESSYTIFARKPGYTPILRAAPGSSGPEVVANILLIASPYPLPPLLSYAPLFGPRTGERTAVGGTSQDALRNAAYLDDPSDIDALAALTPGVQASTDGGYSVLGTASDQNSKLLDGMAFDGSALPPDAQCAVSVNTTTSDPARGQFAGGQTSVTSCHGRDYVQSSLRTSLVDPALSWSDRSAPVAPAQTILASGFLAGPIRTGVAHYHFSVSAMQGRLAQTTLTSGSAAARQQLGLVADSISAFTHALNTIGSPLSAAGVPDHRTIRRATGSLALDWNAGASSTWLLTALGTTGSAAGAGIGPTTLPVAASYSHNANGRIMVQGTNYLGGVVDELTAVTSAGSSRQAGNALLPGGTVRVGAVYDDGSDGVQTLRFGGSGLSSTTETTMTNLRNQFSLAANPHGHALKFGQQFTFAGVTSDRASDTLGHYTYESIADLAANAPSSYMRQLNSVSQHGQSFSSAIWFGDSWRASSRISFEGGLRADWAHYGPAPAYNAAVDSLFNLRTDRLDGSSGLSPRIGFAWLARPFGQNRTTIGRNGAVLHLLYIDPADRQGDVRGNMGGGGTLFGDFGAYRGTLSPRRVSAVQDETGLPGAAEMLSCVGPATPIPVWNTPAGAVFDQCRNGISSVFGDSVPDVSVLAPHFTPPVDWKAHLGYSQALNSNGYLQASLILLDEEHTESSIDANLVRTSQFTLSNETDRPVYVPFTAIAPTGGLIGPLAARVSSRFGPVTEVLSDLHRTAAQFNLIAGIPRLFGFLPVELGYYFNVQHNQARGFDGTTSGDPFAVEAVAGSQPLHEFTLQSLTPAKIWWFRSNARLDITSGVAYTPTVVGDINGDGLDDDRAFVPKPSAQNGALTSEFSQLLATAPSSARSCLLAQQGTIAGANSCRGPWHAQLDFTLEFAPPRGAFLSNRLHFTASFLNAGAALMRLAGISSSVSQTGVPPDGRLLYVTGFDPVAKTFTYQVNTAFGQPLNYGIGNHRYPPFQLRIGAEYQLSRRDPTPLIHRLGLRADAIATIADSTMARILASQVPNPVDTLLALRDSLALSDAQISRLHDIAARFRATLDSATRSDAPALLEHQARLIDSDVYRVLDTYYPFRIRARDAAVEALSADQRAKLAALMRR